MSLEDTTVALRIGMKNVYGKFNYHLILLILEQTIYDDGLCLHDQDDHHDGGGQADFGEKDLEVNEVFPPWL